MRINTFQLLTMTVVGHSGVVAFVPSNTKPAFAVRSLHLAASAGSATAAPAGFIETELRGAAMRLHTREQAPKEGQAESEEPKERHVTTHQEYLQFLVDNLHVYQAFEKVLREHDELEVFRNTGLEREEGLEKDIAFMVKEYKLKQPPVGRFGKAYAEEVERISQAKNIPEFLCHYYNFYFAHTAGGRMIGKQMSALLLNKKTLEFYKWDGDLNDIKARVKDDIEAMVAQWSQEERDECVAATAAAFRFGGGINAYLAGAK